MALSLGFAELATARLGVRSSLLVLDEATSNLDEDSDAAIQALLRADLASRTVLTIAHRLQTILWYDRVLVMDKGRVSEYGSPAELQAKADGAFATLLAEHKKGQRDTA